MAADGNKTDGLGGDELALIATDGGKILAGEPGKLEDEGLESNVAGGTIGKFGELEDEGLELNVADDDMIGKLGKLETEGDELALIAMNGREIGKFSKLKDNNKLGLVSATGGTTDKSDVADGECWSSLSV